eukprot:747107-Hanusia_phi.AAC.15
MSHPTIPTIAGRGASPEGNGVRSSAARDKQGKLTQERQRDEHEGRGDGPVEISRRKQNVRLPVLLDANNTGLTPHAVVDQSLHHQSSTAHCM